MADDFGKISGGWYFTWYLGDMADIFHWISAKYQGDIGGYPTLVMQQRARKYYRYNNGTLQQ